MPFSKGYNHDYWMLFCALADNTLLAVSDVLAYYRIHKHNTAGLAGYKTKRPLIDRISSFRDVGEKNIVCQYIWFNDGLSYIGSRPMPNEKTKTNTYFFSQNRVDAMRKNKVAATWTLIKAYMTGAYAADGKIVFIHDIEFVWSHFKKYRNCLFEDAKGMFRLGVGSADRVRDHYKIKCEN